MRMLVLVPGTDTSVSTGMGVCSHVFNVKCTWITGMCLLFCCTQITDHRPQDSSLLSCLGAFVHLDLMYSLA
jgi:hypothetical protein